MEGEIAKGKIEKEDKNKSQHLHFVYSNTLGCPHCVLQNLKTVALIDAELIRWKNCWKERKMDK